MIRAELAGANHSTLFGNLEAQARELSEQKAARTVLSRRGSTTHFWRSASSLWPNFTQG